MASLAIKVNTRPKQHKVLIELDAIKFEKLAAGFGFFSDEFINSIDKAETDYKAGRFRKINSLKSLT